MDVTMAKPFPAYTGDQPYAFVCYAHDDADVVYPLLSALHEQGCRLWYDEGISPGSEWTQTLADKIEGCAVLLYLLTPRSMASAHCRREINFALDVGVPIQAVHLESVELDGGLRLSLGDRQMIVADELTEPALRDRLVRALAGHHVQGAATIETAEPSQQRGLGRVFALVAIAIVLVATAFYFWPKNNREFPPNNLVVGEVEVIGDVAASQARSVRRNLIAELSVLGLPVHETPNAHSHRLSLEVQHVGDGERLVDMQLRKPNGELLLSRSVREEATTLDAGRFKHAEYLANFANFIVNINAWGAMNTAQQDALRAYLDGMIFFFELSQGYEGDWGAAEAKFELARRLDPEFVPPLHQLLILWKKQDGSSANMERKHRTRSRTGAPDQSTCPGYEPDALHARDSATLSGPRL